MGWGRIDGGFHNHPKVIALKARRGGHRSVSLWACALSWSSEHGTDGAVSSAACRFLGHSSADARRLVEAGLWDEVEDGWRFHDWGDVNPTGSELAEKRRKKTERQRRWREKRDGSVDGLQTRPSHARVPEPDPIVNTPPVNSPPQLTLASPRDEPPDVTPESRAVSEVFECWREHHGSARTKLTDKRRKRIRARLGEGYSAEDLCAAIRGALADSFLMGHTERSDREYRGVDTLLRDGDQVERLAKMDGQPRSQPRGMVPPAPHSHFNDPNRVKSRLERAGEGDF